MNGIRKTSLAFAALAIGLSIILFFEWHTDEPGVVLLVLVAVSLVAGLAVPARFLLFGLCLGWAILAAHLLSTLTGMMIPRYQLQAPSVADWTVMTLLAIPALLATLAGARASASLRGST
jgi:hypothetical protein